MKKVVIFFILIGVVLSCSTPKEKWHHLSRKSDQEFHYDVADCKAVANDIARGVGTQAIIDSKMDDFTRSMLEAHDLLVPPIDRGQVFWDIYRDCMRGKEWSRKWKWMPEK